MSLFGALQVASNSLQATQIGLQVAGQNIANANTPGYSREEVILSAAPAQKVGSLQIGLGVRVDAIVQKVDKFLEERLRGAISDRASSEAQEQAYRSLEGILGELHETDLGSSLNRFFNSISEVLNQPESVAVRNLVVHQGKMLAADIQGLASRVRDERSELNDRVANMAIDINRLIEEIRVLNIRIATTEGGDAGASDAVGLRDQRSVALTSLSKLIDIKSAEQPSGAINVFSNGDFLVFDGTSRQVAAVYESDRGLSAADIRIVDTDTPLGTAAGELAGLLAIRDDVAGGFLDGLDELVGTLAFEFNKVYSSGQGLKGHTQLSSEFLVKPASTVLDQADLPFVPRNGLFEILVFNKQTGLTQTSQIRVDLNGLDNDDSTLDSLAAALDAVGGVSASVDLSGALTLSSDSANVEFAFANDSSGVLAALGLGTFFTGSTALDLAVGDVVADDPARFAASRSGIGGDTANAVDLARFQDLDLTAAGGVRLTDLYDRLTGKITQGSATAHAIADGFRTFESALQGRQLAISGVSLDEEAIRMLTFQRTYQASARFIATISDLLDVLVNL